MTRRVCVCGVVDCRRHGGGNRWHHRASKPLDYNDPVYLRNRAQLLAPKPLCHWCGIRRATTADHLIGAPNGTHELSNLVPACADCNRLRGASRGGQVAKANRERKRRERGPMPPGPTRSEVHSPKGGGKNVP